MKVGFTGSRAGLSEKQGQTLTLWLRQAKALVDLAGQRVIVHEFHHGDCVGADEQAASEAARLGFHTVAHPPIRRTLRAFHRSDVIRPAFDYLDRDRHIVEACDFLIACPGSYEPQERSGTWYTIRHAEKVGRNRVLIFPNGTWDQQPRAG